MADVIIIGRGPAGISAALYLRRANLSVLVLGKDGGALARAERIENYYGLERPLTGAELLENGWRQAAGLGAELVEDEVLDLSWDEEFQVFAKNGDYRAKAVLLATGSARKTAPIRGLTDFEGRGVSYCAICDAFFYRGKDVAVLGAGEYALHEARGLLGIARSVTLLTDGAPLTAEFPPDIAVETARVEEILGTRAVEGVRLAGGAQRALSGVFVALGSAAASDLARRLGAEIDGSRILVDAEMATAVPGLFAAGDCTGGLQQVATAVAGGAKAAMSLLRFVRGK
ncbi:MAG: FAD-dependent oxidoreductase [Oscillospiraceae bacterium]